MRGRSEKLQVILILSNAESYILFRGYPAAYDNI